MPNETTGHKQEESQLRQYGASGAMDAVSVFPMYAGPNPMGTGRSNVRWQTSLTVY